ncbi:hypothetical protein B0H67DRAFT_644261 [Lasiosphaeris hirsuta]|uniref:Uncharacterized protein n=1 Tax=Lasiosphaeris hirsuta TaxID=260670 RepID=A0AA40E3D4_9PEZI|nr:hypothetical protein B0H67DRAFT_644261 [Lasiosphaeris hirsuta]
MEDHAMNNRTVELCKGHRWEGSTDIFAGIGQRSQLSTSRPSFATTPRTGSTLASPPGTPSWPRVLEAFRKTRNAFVDNAALLVSGYAKDMPPPCGYRGWPWLQPVRQYWWIVVASLSFVGMWAYLKDLEWSFIQVLALATWFPIMVDFVYILVFSPQEGLEGHISKRYSVARNATWESGLHGRRDGGVEVDDGGVDGNTKSQRSDTKLPLMSVDPPGNLFSP